MHEGDTQQRFQREQRRVASGMGAGVVVTLAVPLLLVGLQPFSLPHFPTTAARLDFVVRIDILVVAWLGAAIANVARLRFFSATDIEGSWQSEPSASVRRASAMVQNTLEQVVFATGSHCALATQLPERWMMIVPGLVGLFCLGRALFWLSYRHGAGARAFGFALTFYPSIGACVAAIILWWR